VDDVTTACERSYVYVRMVGLFYIGLICWIFMGTRVLIFFDASRLDGLCVVCRLWCACILAKRLSVSVIAFLRVCLLSRSFSLRCMLMMLPVVSAVMFTRLWLASDTRRCINVFWLSERLIVIVVLWRCRSKHSRLCTTRLCPTSCWLHTGINKKPSCRWDS